MTRFSITLSLALAIPATALAVDADNDTYEDTCDCDDTNAAVNPGATEICDDGIDNDCDGDTDADDSDCDPTVLELKAQGKAIETAKAEREGLQARLAKSEKALEKAQKDLATALEGFAPKSEVEALRTELAAAKTARDALVARIDDVDQRVEALEVWRTGVDEDRTQARWERAELGQEIEKVDARVAVLEDTKSSVGGYAVVTAVFTKSPTGAGVVDPGAGAGAIWRQFFAANQMETRLTAGVLKSSLGLQGQGGLGIAWQRTDVMAYGLDAQVSYGYMSFTDVTVSGLGLQILPRVDFDLGTVNLEVLGGVNFLVQPQYTNWADDCKEYEPAQGAAMSGVLGTRLSF